MREIKKTLYTIAVLYLCMALVVFIVMIYFLIQFESQQNVYEHSITERNFYQEIYNPRQTQEDIAFLIRHDINQAITKIDRRIVHGFFNQYTRNQRITELIINHAIEREVPVNIAFSVAWAESSFNPYAINTSNRNGTADWGLFQLNDNYYRWTREQFFDIEQNIAAGIAHLDFVIEEMNDIYYALAAYNAGVYGVTRHGVPDITLRYINNILEFEDRLNQDFNSFIQEINSGS